MEGVDVTGIMYRDPRPGNVCHLGVDACISMKKLSEAFGTSLSEFTVSYFLPLPQSFAPSRADYSKLASASDALPTVADTMDSFYFLPSSKKVRREGKPPPSQKSTFQLEMELAGKTPTLGEREEEEKEESNEGSDSGNGGDTDVTPNTMTCANRKTLEEMKREMGELGT